MYDVYYLVDCPNCGKPIPCTAKESGVEHDFELIDGSQVPSSFLEFLEAYFLNEPIEYGVELSAETLFDERTWYLFNDDLRKVALACVLHLIEEGAVIVYSPEED